MDQTFIALLVLRWVWKNVWTVFLTSHGLYQILNYSLQYQIYDCKKTSTILHLQMASLGQVYGIRQDLKLPYHFMKLRMSESRRND